LIQDYSTRLPRRDKEIIGEISREECDGDEFNMAAHMLALSRIVRYDVVAKHQEAEEGNVCPEG
jgi:uncharacterized protein YuzE